MCRKKKFFLAVGGFKVFISRIIHYLESYVKIYFQNFLTMKLPSWVLFDRVFVIKMIIRWFWFFKSRTLSLNLCLNYTTNF